MASGLHSVPLSGTATKLLTLERLPSSLLDHLQAGNVPPGDTAMSNYNYQGAWRILQAVLFVYGPASRGERVRWFLRGMGAFLSVPAASGFEHPRYVCLSSARTGRAAVRLPDQKA